MDRVFSLLVHGESKVGKTWLGNTTPAPRLILDAEGGINWVPGSKIWWEPSLQGNAEHTVYGAPPAVGIAGHDGTPWETCVVKVRDYQTVVTVYQWLASGQHPFESVVVDSISEIQKRLKDNIGALDQWTQQMWGQLLAGMEKLVRDFRDLRDHPTKPVQAVVLIAMTKQIDGKFRPFVQGALATSLPFFIDVIGYLFVQTLEDGTQIRRLLVSPNPDYEAGERVGGRLGLVVDNPNVVTMIEQIYGPEPVAAATE